METPTISKTQKKSTLSAKKTKPKETIKNVIATPYKNSYWPQMSPEDQEALKTVLQNHLPRLKPKKVNVPWSELKNVSKSERKKFRNEYTKNGESGINKTIREGITFGINDVTKLLENNSAGVVLISSNVQPRIMVQHILDEAVLYRVPVVVFNNLREFVHKICGIKSAVISISNNVSPQSKLNQIKEFVTQIFEKYPPPIDHINYNRSLQNSKNTEISERDARGGVEVSKPEVVSNDDETMEISQQIEDEKVETHRNETELDFESTIYLKRESKDKRVFVPEDVEENVKSYKMEVDSTGFLAFSEPSAPKAENKIVETSYKSLIVKRLKGDPNRSKRKIASFKRKLK